MKIVVVGASSGLGRTMSIELGNRGHDVVLMARRKERLEGAVAEISGTAHAVRCDVTDPATVETAFAEAAELLGGIDAVLYATGIGIIGRLSAPDADVWNRTFATNVTGAVLVTAAALPHLQESKGCTIFFSSISSSVTPPWPGLASYVASKTALNKVVDAWRIEHPEVGFTCLTVGDCAGGDGESQTEFTSEWDMELASEFGVTWFEKGYITGSLMDVQDLINAVEPVIALGKSATVPSITVMPRVPLDTGRLTREQMQASVEASQA